MGVQWGIKITGLVKNRSAGFQTWKAPPFWFMVRPELDEIVRNNTYRLYCLHDVTNLYKIDHLTFLYNVADHHITGGF